MSLLKVADDFRIKLATEKAQAKFEVLLKHWKQKLDAGSKGLGIHPSGMGNDALRDWEMLSKPDEELDEVQLQEKQIIMEHYPGWTPQDFEALANMVRNLPFKYEDLSPELKQIAEGDAYQKQEDVRESTPEELIKLMFSEVDNLLELEVKKRESKWFGKGEQSDTEKSLSYIRILLSLLSQRLR